MTPRLPGRDARFILALGVLGLLHAAANVYWLAADTRPPTYDTAGHAMVSLRLAERLAAGEWRLAGRLLMVQNYPPVVYLLAAPLAIVGPPTIDTLTLVNLPFLGLLMLATFGIARELAGPAYGLLAGSLVSMYPFVYGLSRQLLLDLPLAATVALSMWLLLRVGRFENARWSLALGGALGLGLMTKTTFAQFVAAPLFIVTVRAFVRCSRRQIVHMGLGAAVALAMSAKWYVRNLAPQLQFIRFQTIAAAAEGDPAVGTLQSWLSYLSAAGEVQVMLPLLAAFMVGTLATLIARRYRTDYRLWLLTAWLSVPYVALALQPNKDPRYSTPFLPAMAVLTALGLSTVRSRFARAAGILVFGAWALVQFAGLTFGLRGYLLPRSLPLPVFTRIGKVVTLVVYSEEAQTITPARRQDWQTRAILADIAADREARRPSGVDGPPDATRVVVLPNTPFFEGNVFMYEVLAERMRGVEIQRVAEVVAVADARDRVLAAHYVVAKSGDPGPSWTVHDTPALTAELREGRGDLGRLFESLRVYPLPDESEAFLFRRRVDAPAAGEPAP